MPSQPTSALATERGDKSACNPSHIALLSEEHQEMATGNSPCEFGKVWTLFFRYENRQTDQ